MKSKNAKIQGEITRFSLCLRAIDRSLRRLAPLLSAATTINGSSKGNGGHRRPRLSAKARASLILQGRYMGYMRQLKPRQKAQVREIREAKGVKGAIAEARNLLRS